MQLIALGSDPESFLEDEKGKVTSAIGKIGGTKDEPKPLPSVGRGFFVQEDNVLLEYNTPPAKSVSLWAGYHRNVRMYLASMVGQLGLQLSTKASYSMSKDQLNHPKAFVFGCDPDFDVWSLKWNPKPQCADPNLRSAGGHIHVAYENPNPADSIRLGRILDYWVGAPLAKLDPDKDRQKLYGRPGAIRFKPYGLEYRTPSNWWTLTEQATNAVYQNIMIAFEHLNMVEDQPQYPESARRFLAGEAPDFQRDYFDARGVPYGETPGGKPKKPKVPRMEDFMSFESYKQAKAKYTADLAAWNQSQQLKEALFTLDLETLHLGEIVAPTEEGHEEEGE